MYVVYCILGKVDPHTDCPRVEFFPFLPFFQPDCKQNHIQTF